MFNADLIIISNEVLSPEAQDQIEMVKAHINETRMFCYISRKTVNHNQKQLYIDCLLDIDDPANISLL